MKDWKNATDMEIDYMSFDEAREIVQKHIDLGYRDGDFRPRKHMVKALEIILGMAEMYDEVCE